MTAIVSDRVLNQAATGAQTSIICEPSVATSGKRVLVSGNWFSSRSTDRGATWSFVDPFTELPSTGAGVCCDQLVHYSKSRRLWIWLLQFRKTVGGNIIRVAVSSTGAPGTWTWWDTAPTDLDGSWAHLWFDYPDLAETDDHLLLSFNLFRVSDDRWERAAVLRFSLDELKARGAVGRQGWSTVEVGSLRFARGAGGDALFAGHSSSVAGVVVFSWPAGSNGVTETTVVVTDWSDGPYVSAGPGGQPWLNRLDDRITGGWRANGVCGFAWSAAADAAHGHPYIRVVRIDEASLTLIDEPDLWSSVCAWAYPAAITNRRGDVGMAAFCGGGGTSHPTLAFGTYDESSNSWDMTTGAGSTHGPRDGIWGDYLDIQADPSRKTYWVASGFVLNGGAARFQIEPHVVTFKP